MVGFASWVSYVGSFVGLLTGAFVLSDRLLAGRPMLTLQRTSTSDGQRINLLVRNPSGEDILVRIAQPAPSAGVTIQPDDGAIDPSQPFEALVGSKDARLFPLQLLDSTAIDERSHLTFVVGWTRLRSTWLPQWPSRMTTTRRTLEELERAL